MWRSGEPQLLPDVPASRLEALARSPEHLRRMLDLGLRSVIHVPLLGRTGSLGVMTLGTTSHRPR